jgi:cytochrome o ubiquinol oxidase subunit 2
MFALFNLAILDPKGIIALEQRNLLFMAILLILIVVVPALFLTYYFAWKYRADNTKVIREPSQNHNSMVVILWWVLPSLVILALALITWQQTHTLDPYKQIESDVKPITIQVVALPWKWLFIYPEQHIATVNFIQVPINASIHFQLTADNVPMSSMWVPQLGGQMYAMTGMSTTLHLMANEPGVFAGSAAEVNGAGFAGMKFKVQSSSQDEFDQWVESVKQSPNILNQENYALLLKPSGNVPPNYYSNVDDNLYDSIIMKYMAPRQEIPAAQEMKGMEM